MYDTDICSYAKKGDLEGLKKRVALKGKDIINQEMESGAFTALIVASLEGLLPIVQYLINEGANMNHKTSCGNTALMFASEKGHLPIVQFLISRNDPTINEKNGKDLTALMKASKGGHFEIVGQLSANHAIIDSKDTSGATALFWAAQNGHLPVIECLLNNKAKVNEKNNSNNTALHRACSPSILFSNATAAEMIKVLIANNASETIENSDGKTPFQLAQAEPLRREAMVKAIQEKNASSVCIVFIQIFITCVRFFYLFTLFI